MSDVTLPTDVVERVSVSFAKEDVARVLAALAQYSGPERGRVLRCIVQLSSGSLETLQHHVRNATSDYRDVIYWAEYDREDRRIRDFSKGFA